MKFVCRQFLNSIKQSLSGILAYTNPYYIYTDIYECFEICINLYDFKRMNSMRIS